MADPANALCTTSVVKTLLGITAATWDTTIETIVGMVSTHAENYCGRKFVIPAASITEYHDIADDGISDIFVRQPPITSITSINEDSSRTYATASLLTVNTDYLFYATSGRIRRLGTTFSVGEQSIKIVYVGGYASTSAIPTDLNFAAAHACCYLFKQNKPHSGERIGISSHSLQGQSVSYLQTLPSYVTDIYNLYRIGMVG